MLLALLGETEGELSLTKGDYSEELITQSLVKSDFEYGSLWFHLYMSQLHYLYGSNESALKYSMVAEEKKIYGPGFMKFTEQYFYHAMILAANYPFASGSEQKSYLITIDDRLQQLKVWAENCPENYRHKMLLVEAERCKALGEMEKSHDLYDQAIDSAHQHGYMQNEALANELAARAYLDKGKEKAAKGYLDDAHSLYERWGAARKRIKLEEEFPYLRTKMVKSFRSITTKTIGGDENNNLDIDSIMKVSRAISKEIVLENLLKKFMTLVLENAGADKGLLLLSEGKTTELWVKAKSSGNEQVEVLTAEKAGESSEIPQSIVNYVARSLKPVVLGDATREGDFTTDPYIQEYKPKSILCLPILNQAKLLGLLYLENCIASHAFTPDRLEVLKFLASQAAISIENARLYNSLLESEVRQSDLLNNTSSVIYIKDLDGRYLFINQNVRENISHL